MRFALSGDEPAIECVVDHEAVPQHGVIIRNVDRKPQRNRKQTGRLRGKLHTVGIGTPDDRCNPAERWIGEMIILDKGVEGAALAAMGEGDARDIIGNGAGIFRNLENVSGRHVDETRVGVDKSPDQPGAGDPIDLWPFASNPQRGRARKCGNCTTSSAPGLEAAFQKLGGYSEPAQSLCGALASLFAMGAIDNDFPGKIQVQRPSCSSARIAANGVGDCAF